MRTVRDKREPCGSCGLDIGLSKFQNEVVPVGARVYCWECARIEGVCDICFLTECLPDCAGLTMEDVTFGRGLKEV